MKKTILTTILCLATLWAMAEHWDGPMGIYLKTNTGSITEEAVSQHFRLTSSDWGDNAYSSTINHTSELNGVDLGEITSLKLDGGIYIGGRNDTEWPHHWYETGDFKLQYCVYRQGETAPDWSECELLTLDNEVSKTETEGGNKIQYVYDATNKDVNLIALTNKIAGTYVLRVRMEMTKHYWNEDNSNGSWTKSTDPQEATFTIKNYVTGTGNNDANSHFCGGVYWHAIYDAGLLNNGSKTYTNVAPGEYEFKIITGSWENEIGYADLNEEACDKNVHNSGNSVVITTDATSDITINLDANGKVSVISSLGRFVRLPYSVVGDPALGINWEPTNTATEMTRQDDGTYRYTLYDTDLEAHDGRKFKIVGGHAWGTYQAPASGDFTVDIPTNGTYDLVFNFDPVTDQASCTPVLHHDITVSQYQYSTFYSDKAWSVPEGLTALIFTGVENEMLVMESIDVIPANTGVVLYGAASATYTLAETETDVTYPTNLLHGTLGNEVIDNSNVHYILGLSQGECGMFWPHGTTNGVGAFTNQAGKAYLELPGNTPAPARIRGFVFSAPSVATGVYDAEIQEADGACYDLLGRKVSTPQQGGLYIMNGKKVIIL